MRIVNTIFRTVGVICGLGFAFIGYLVMKADVWEQGLPVGQHTGLLMIIVGVGCAIGAICFWGNQPTITHQPVNPIRHRPPQIGQ